MIKVLIEEEVELCLGVEVLLFTLREVADLHLCISLHLISLRTST
jgi:hypothetical protein